MDTRGLCRLECWLVLLVVLALSKMTDERPLQPWNQLLAIATASSIRGAISNPPTDDQTRAGASTGCLVRLLLSVQPLSRTSMRSLLGTCVYKVQGSSDLLRRSLSD
jgi:hypothetical protein